MQDLNDLYFFARVVEHGGFAPAARALDMHKSKLSRRIALLEEKLGVRLIQRSTRRFAVTEIGQAYYGHCVAMLVEAEAAQEAVERTRAEPQGIVRLACPTALLEYQVADMLSRYMAACPRVQIHVESTNRRVDVIREGFDLAIRVRFPPLEDTDLVMKVLGDSLQRLVAHPDLIAPLGEVRVPADLASVASVAWGPAQREHLWALEGPDGASAQVRHAPRLVTDDLATLRSAALHGIGVAQLPTMMVRDDLASGRLIDVLPHWAPRCGIAHVVFPSRRGLLPAVRGLVDHLAGEFAQLPSDRPVAGGQTVSRVGL
ncbi:Transcriptional regulator, LysR family [Methyloversatilis universalis FAM5]|uniref:Transcriptional regulator, LysR family n=1 Tax=Methyloversatilis universalis (strain ATCC BAA-1314 / DSM 25237 / JCM 13912 / CCUG 52030 / FAM5) TaxID=1000565 RepID=F5RGX5_METUF|nr:LysR family transcriptional regulator [Methyloversatilis universalis]EGK70179.1 Transcriptional regulator, LysR family [Methyloversatilis universalis FAM5]